MAPFDGIVTKVNVAGGDQVYKGAVIVEVADPNQFEASILVSEMNISQVKVGGTATVTADAISGVTWSANVTQIAPTATISSGVVNYAVEVQVGSIIPTTRIPSGNVTPPSGNVTSTLSQALKAAVTAGRLTQQQATALQSAVASGRMTQQQAENIAAERLPVRVNPGAGRLRRLGELDAGTRIFLLRSERRLKKPDSNEHGAKHPA